MALVALAATLLGSGIPPPRKPVRSPHPPDRHFELAIITSDKYHRTRRRLRTRCSEDLRGVPVRRRAGVEIEGRVDRGEGHGARAKTKITENPETTFSARGEYIGPSPDRSRLRPIDRQLHRQPLHGRRAQEALGFRWKSRPARASRVPPSIPATDTLELRCGRWIGGILRARWLQSRGRERFARPETRTTRSLPSGEGGSRPCRK